jgi:hypothetical protein
LIINDINSSYTIDFDNSVAGVNDGAYAGAGFSPAPGAGQLNTDAWVADGMSDVGDPVNFGDTATTGDFARGPSPGSVTTGGYYGFDVDNDPNAVNRAFGIQPGGDDWTPGTVTLRLQNTSGQEISELTVSYLIYTRNDAARASSFNFAHSADNAAYTSVPALDFTSEEAISLVDPPIPWVVAPRTTTLTGLSIANNAYYYLRWNGDDVSGSGARDEFALDDISISKIVVIPEPATIALAGLAVLGLMGIARRAPRSH